jgi:hypothetical protein
MYSQKTPSPYGYGKDSLSIFHKAHPVAMLKACVFGDRFLASTFTKAICHELVKVLVNNQYITDKALIWAVRNLAPEDPLIQMMAHVCCEDSMGLA